MNTKRTTTLRDCGEQRLIAAIRSWLGAACPPSPAGIGDDCAVVPRSGKPTLVTVDPVIRGRHFDASLSAAAVARKLLKRNLSDIAAMGGVPRRAVVALAAPPDLPVSWLRSFFVALGREARRFGVSVVGGDCAQTEGFFGAWITLLGEVASRPLTRTGGRRGDVLFVSGRLGGSIAGRHHTFTPRLAEGRWLARRRAVHAAIDLSDGLGKDLPAIVPRGCSAVIDVPAIPLSAAARRQARSAGRDPLDAALNDGEDYELLFAVAPREAASLERAWRREFSTPLTRIGRLEARPRDRRAIRFDPPLPPGVEPHGYEHFR